MSDVVKRLRISEESATYIDDYSKKNGIQPTHMNRAINEIIKEHKEYREAASDKDNLQEELINQVSESISSNVKKEMSRILLGVNNTDRNTQIVLQLMNGFMINQNFQSILTTDEHETSGLKTAKEKVAEDIQNQKQNVMTG
ncbi:hypothetical protein [Sinobaca sp. H24]|uniref:hypothetical protein n=1 Tax=Sinobaca sp. H24 TaxID=2923376 RepID=UPI00207A721F|nr:hypothetical protein [Sinobaca sp. H24]